ncbi:MAG: hypothetical protein ACWGMY_06405, partial [Hyphomicrobiaceae bacterium]
DEAALGADNPYTRLAKMLLSRLGVNYQSCSISPDHFLPHDGHPSEAGYAQVGECLQRILRRSRAGGSETSQN